MSTSNVSRWESKLLAGAISTPSSLPSKSTSEANREGTSPQREWATKLTQAHPKVASVKAISSQRAGPFGSQPGKARNPRPAPDKYRIFDSTSLDRSEFSVFLDFVAFLARFRWPVSLWSPGGPVTLHRYRAWGDLAPIACGAHQIEFFSFHAEG